MTKEDVYIDPFKDFRHSIFYEEIYKYYDMAEEELTFVLQRKIKGNMIIKGFYQGELELKNNLSDI